MRRLQPLNIETLFWCAAIIAALPCLLVPIYNPDLFWHLSAAERITQLRAIPMQDWTR